MTPTSISGDDLENWAARIDASAILPELVRRLILATAEPRTVQFRAHGGTRHGGWDGTVESANVGGAFCPRGLSFWELSTEENVKKKLESDYKKRPAESGATYVAVTGRRFAKTQDWAAQKRRSGAWADVRALDADDLATWLSEAPAVAVWFAAEHLGHPVDDISTPDEFLNAWSNQTRPQLPRELLLLGNERKRAAQLIADWSDRTPGRLLISGATREEALRFVVAAMLALPDGAELSTRMLVVRSERALRWAERQRQSLIIIPTLDAASLLSSSHHHVALAVDREGRRPADVEVGLIPYSLIEGELSRVGVPDAARLARESGGALPALVRLCGATGRPPWAATPTRALLGLVLAGEWTGGDADVATVETLAAASKSEIDDLCVRLSRCPDPPMRCHRESHGPTTWRWSSPKDAWTVLCGDLTDTALEEFRKVALDVLGEENPVFTLPHNDRFLAPLHGKVLTRSGPLRMGIARSLARLSLSDGELTGATRYRGPTLAVAVVRTVLRSDWITWASLTDVLPVLAEAAPDAFLDALGQSIEAGNQGVQHLFSEEGTFSSPHTGLLWALERLGWSGARMPRVARALARLSQLDPGGRLANRPSASLTNLLNPFRPSTNASIEERVTTLRQLHVDYPAAAWSLSIKLAGMLRGTTVFSSNPPEFLPDSSETKTVSGGEFTQFGAALADTLLQHAGHSTGRWSELLKIRLAIGSARPNFFDALEAGVLVGDVLDPDQKLWSDVRLALHQTHFVKRDPADPELARLQRLYLALTPPDPVSAVAWLFCPPSPIPEHFPNGWREEQERLDALRRAGITQLYRPDNLAPLNALSAAVTQPLDLGILLAKMPFARQLEPILLDLRFEDWVRVRPGVFAVLAAERGHEWSEQHLRALLSNDRLAEATQSARMLPWKPETWDMIAGIAPALRTAYWLSRPILYPQDKVDAERFVSELVGVGAFAQAFNVASHYANDISSDLLLGLLDKLSTDANELAQAEDGSWGASQVFERLNRDINVEDDRLAGLELRFLPWLQDPAGGTQDLRLFQALERQPEFFAQLIEHLYRPEVDPDADAPEDEPSDAITAERKRAAAQNAFSVRIPVHLSARSAWT